MVSYGDMEPKIIFEDDDLLVLDKPSGITVNRSETTVGETTVQDWLEKNFPIFKAPADLNLSVKPKIAGQFTEGDRELDFYRRAGIVHRIDKETSGILLVAKNPQAFVNLQNQFKERKVKKIYVALAHGRIEPSEGDVRVPVGRLPWNRTKFGVVVGGKEAVTRYKVIKNLQLTINHEPLTLLELYPETGRTHQIRVHLKYSNHSIFGDFLYGGRKTSRNDRMLVPRVFLHAGKISFLHPKTGKLVSFESQLPKELQDFINNLSVI